MRHVYQTDRQTDRPTDGLIHSETETEIGRHANEFPDQEHDRDIGFRKCATVIYSNRRLFDATLTSSRVVHFLPSQWVTLFFELQNHSPENLQQMILQRKNAKQKQNENG